MAWSRWDDAMGEHRKTRRLLKAGGLDSFGLHALAILHCSRYLTDGFVEAEFVDETLDAAKVRGKARERITEKLAENGQWVVCDGGWMIHDYLDHNPSRAEVEARRAADAERKAKGRRSDSRRSPQGVQPDSARTDAGVREESARPVLSPSQALPDPMPPLPPRGNRARDQVAYEETLSSFAAEHFPGAAPGLVAHLASQLRSRRTEPTVDALRPLIEQHTNGAAA